MNKFIGRGQNSFIYEGVFYDTMVTFDCDHNSKSIIIYTDNTYEDGNICVYASYYSVTQNGQLILDEIDSDFDYDIVIAVLDKVTETVRKGVDLDDIADIVSEYINTTRRND